MNRSAPGRSTCVFHADRSHRPQERESITGEDTLLTYPTESRSPLRLCGMTPTVSRTPYKVQIASQHPYIGGE
jgi:hypothetical protein